MGQEACGAIFNIVVCESVVSTAIFKMVKGAIAEQAVEVFGSVGFVTGKAFTLIITEIAGAVFHQ